MLLALYSARGLCSELMLYQKVLLRKPLSKSVEDAANKSWHQDQTVVEETVRFPTTTLLASRKLATHSLGLTLLDLPSVFNVTLLCTGIVAFGVGNFDFLKVQGHFLSGYILRLSATADRVVHHLYVF